MRRSLKRFDDNQFGHTGRSHFYDDFDKKFNQGFKLAIVGIAFGWLVGLSILGFVGWVVYKLLQHNGVI